MFLYELLRQLSKNAEHILLRLQNSCCCNLECNYAFSLASAASNLVIFSSIFFSIASRIVTFDIDKIWAANRAAFAGLQMKALELPGGFVRQVLFMPSGGQLTTGHTAWYDAVPLRASVPPAHPMRTNGSAELLNFFKRCSNRAGCLCAEHTRNWAG